MANEKKRIEAIYHLALEKKNKKERSAYLDSACGDDSKLRASVEGLLQAHDKAGDFLEVPPFDPDVTLDTSPLSEGPGTTIGRYKLLELIGEGGFGVVYMAEQAEPIRRKVALKIIKLGMDTRQVIGRFEAERQALALMEHPNIARVLDAGATETGRPYFVMELVRGISITEYCDKNNLDTQQRLKLFIEVCKAVQHAHQKGIIHRDIKPSNVMVTRHNGTAVPKVIDFGIAKATQHQLTEKTFFTEYHQLIGTPEYMSPEQAELSDPDIDTRTDIYSLGVMLYELLTGTTPFERKELLSASYDQMRRIIRETDPPKPSTRLSALGDELTEVARHRHTNPGELCKIIRGDLDWVVMKTLEKDRARRYETANELGMDVERHLKDEPVVAGPPSSLYRLRKFVRRNRMLVTSVAVVLVVLVGGIVASTIFAVGQARARAEAERQAKISQAVADFLETDVLASVEPAKAMGPEVTVRYILDEASESMGDKFEDEPLVEASIRQTLGKTYRELGEYKAAETHLERALQVHREQLGAEHPDTLSSMNSLAWLHFKQGRYDEAERLHVKTLEIQRRVLGEENPHTLASMNNLAAVYADQGRYDEAHALCIETLEIRRRVLGEEHPDTLTSMNNLAIRYNNQSRYDEAERLHIKTLEIKRRVLGEEHPDTLNSMHNLTAVYKNQGRYDEAEQLYIKTLEIWRRVLGDEHPDTLNSMSGLAAVYIDQGRYDEAERLHIKTLEIKRRVLGEEHPNTLMSMHNLAIVYESQGRYNEAEALRIKTLEIKRRVLGEEHPSTLGSMGSLAGVYDSQGRYEEAEQLHIKTLEIHRRVLGEEHPSTLASMNNLAMVYWDQGRYDEAERLHIRTLEIQRRVLGEEHPDTLASMEGLAVVHGNQGRYDEAERLRIKTLEIKRRVLGEEHPNTLTSMNNLAWLYHKQERYDEAERLHVKTLEIKRRVLGEEHPHTLYSMNNLAAVYADQGRYDEAHALYVETLEIRRRVLGEEHPDTLTSINDLGWLYRKQERYDEAEQPYVKALEGRRSVLGEEHPDTLWTMNDLAWLYRKQERYDEAEQLYVKALEGRRRVLGEEHPDTLWTMNDLAWLYDKEGRYDEAESLYGEVLEIKRRILGEEHPDTLTTMNILAWRLATNPDIQLHNPVRAVELAKKVVEAAPDKGIYWNTLGLAYYRANQWEASIKALDKSIELQGPNSHDFFFLAMTHWQLGNRDEARQWYERAVEWMEQNQPDNEELARFRAEAAELLGLSEPTGGKDVSPEKTEDKEQ